MVRRYLLVMALLAAIFLPGITSNVWAENKVMETAMEYDLKAVYLYNFLRFTNVPQQIKNSKKEIFSIGVLGNSPILAPLELIAKKSNGKVRVGSVLSTASQKDFTSYDLLFISESERGKLSKVIAALSSLPVLTVSDIDTFCNEGGMIRLVTIDNRIRWEINLEQIKLSGLSVKAQLLKSAWKVR